MNDKKIDDIEGICLCGHKVRLTAAERRKLWDNARGREVLAWIKSEFGEFKKVTEAATGLTYKVPTEDIVIYGLQAGDLPYYLLWEG